MSDMFRVQKPGIVTRVIKSSFPTEPEIAEIGIEGADPLYREIRIVNSFEGGGLRNRRLAEGTRVTVTIEADLGGLPGRYGN